jgi:hypothetical protein
MRFRQKSFCAPTVLCTAGKLHQMKFLLGLLLLPLAIALDTQIYDIADFQDESGVRYNTPDYTLIDDQEEYADDQDNSFEDDQEEFSDDQEYVPNEDQDYDDGYEEDYDGEDAQQYQDPASQMSAKEFQSGKAETVNQMSPSFRALINNEDSAEDEDSPDTNPVEGDATKKFGIPSNSPYTVVAAILLICTGAFILFFGQNAFKPILFISGAYLFGIFTYALLNYLRTHKTITLEKNVPLIYAASITGAGLIGGGIFLCLWKIASYLFGAALGFVVSILFLSLPFTSNFNQTVRIVILCVFIAIGVILGGFFQKPILIISTATLGSYWVFSGGDIFLKTGFGSLVRAMRDKERIPMKVGTWFMLFGFVLVSIIGSIIQFRLSRKGIASYTPVNKV